jgi:hypothetical protein
VDLQQQQQQQEGWIASQLLLLLPLLLPRQEAEMPAQQELQTSEYCC